MVAEEGVFGCQSQEIKHQNNDLRGIFGGQSALAETNHRIGTKRRFHTQKDVARICAEENMISQLAECLSWNNDYDGECYMVLAKYGNLLDSSTRRKIVEGHIDKIRTRAIPTDSRRYCYIVSNMKALRDSCDEGRTAVNELIEEFRVQYRRRPSMMSELDKLC